MKKLNTQDMKKILILTISLVIMVIGCIFTKWWITIPVIIVIDCFLLNFDIKRKNGKLKITKKKKKKEGFRKKWKIFLLVILSFGAFILLSIIGFISYIIITTPDFDPNRLYKKDATIVYGTNGEIIAKLGAQNREKVTYEDLSEEFVNALVATEDSRFFQHNGFDLPRFLKASVGQLLGRNAGGASTLTMQVSKNNYTSTEASGIEGIIRKFRDIYISIFQIEKKYTKEEILEFYVNDPWLGSVAYGIEQAAQIYFGKSIKEVNLAEAAMLAGIFNAPSSLDPFKYPENCEARRKTVLYLMERHGYITAEERAAANLMTVDKLLTKKTSESESYSAFTDLLVEQIINLTGNDPYVVPMEIYSTMDKQIQADINDIMSGETFNWENDEVQAGISIIDVNTGAVVAIGNGRNRNERGYSFASDIKRQIGSTAKPLYDYGPGIEFNNWSTYHPFVDEQTTYSDGTPINNYDSKYDGLISLRYSLADSRNIPALKAFKSVKSTDIKKFVTSLGLSPEDYLHEAHAIGGYNGESPLTLSAAYAAFANGGYYTTPYTFTKLVYRETGKTYEYKPQKNSVMSKETAYMMTSLLKSQADHILKRYFSGALYGSKTGTTTYGAAEIKDFNIPKNAVMDKWVAAINTKYSIAVWYGYENIPPVNAEVRHFVTLSNANHARLFAAAAKKVFKGNEDWVKPKDVVEIAIEKDNYQELLASEFTPEDMIVKELYKVGTEPTEVSSRYDRLSNVTNLNATIDNYKLTLTWDPIPTPNAINNDYLRNYFNQVYSTDKMREKYYNERIAYNNANIGTLGYNVYTKDSNGNLTLLGFTSSNSYTYQITSTHPVTFVVKSVYSIFKANMSTGAELTENFSNIESPVNVSINGKNSVEIEVDTTFADELKPVIVLENLIDVTDKASIDTTITRKSDGATVKTITSLVPDEFTIVYNVKYKNQTYEVKKTVKVVEHS